ncbi:hypothetical protein GCM10009304_11930 [Pseudomonas matsuisoli]|uniref:Uncharacterized protein n=1 Tax=Pseudomonas matsuisoli TaxID=1515666 RepID=A0A917UVI2_9PSED|nr:hypothetical protein GCM10009304_11930 [Pseudomonas matsuisoli]
MDGNLCDRFPAPTLATAVGSAIVGRLFGKRSDLDAARRPLTGRALSATDVDRQLQWSFAHDKTVLMAQHQVRGDRGCSKRREKRM